MIYFVLKRRMPEMKVINVSKSALGERLSKCLMNSDSIFITQKTWRRDVLWMIHSPQKICEILLAIVVQVHYGTSINHILSFGLRDGEQVCKNLGVISEYSLVHTE
jgi:hypothetical protein